MPFNDLTATSLAKVSASNPAADTLLAPDRHWCHTFTECACYELANIQKTTWHSERIINILAPTM